MSSPRLSVWPPLSPGAHWHQPFVRLPFPLDDPRCRLFGRARHGLYRALERLVLEPDDEFLVPAYHHGSEIEALAQAGISCRFYDLDDDLQPQSAQLDALVAEGRTKGLYLIHYLGWPQDVPRWRAWCDERSLLLVEDAAQAWLASRDGKPLGSWGDVSLFCLYKTFGLADGAALLSQSAPGADTDDKLTRGSLAVLKRHAAWMESRSALLATATAPLRGDGSYDPRFDFALGDPRALPARATLSLLPRVARAEAAAERRANYQTLLDQLGGMVPSPFDELPAGAVPFAFPISVRDKVGMLRRLEDHGVMGLDLWSRPHPSLQDPRAFAVAERRATTIGLPVHQELRPKDLDRIASAAQVRSATRRLELNEVTAAEIRAEWERLALLSRNIFSTWEWAEVWRRHFLGDRPVSIQAVGGPGGRPAALLPLYLWSGGPFKVARLLGHGPADQLGPVCADAEVARAARALRLALGSLPWGCDGFLGDYLPSDRSWTSLLGARVLRRFDSPVLRFEGDWDAYLASRSSNLREQVRRRERALHRSHDVRFRLAEDPEHLQSDLDVLFKLYDARWPVGERAFSAAQSFHREFATLAMSRGWLRLWFLELDGRAVAAWYGFRFAGAESFYQAGRDPAAADASVGFVLLTHTMRETLDDGLHEYRFLRGGESYKYRFATEDPGLETIGMGRGPASGALLGMAARVGGWRPARQAFKRFIA